MLIKEDSELTTERLLLVVIAVMAIFAFLDLLMQLFYPTISAHCRNHPPPHRWGCYYW